MLDKFIKVSMMRGQAGCCIALSKLAFDCFKDKLKRCFWSLITFNYSGLSFAVFVGVHESVCLLKQLQDTARALWIKPADTT